MVGKGEPMFPADKPGEPKKVVKILVEGDDWVTPPPFEAEEFDEDKNEAELWFGTAENPIRFQGESG